MVSINGIKFNDAEFHNGEVIFEKPEKLNDTENTFTMAFESNKDITALLFAKKYVDEQYPNAFNILVMRYCPYERMDREINNQMFSMKYFAKIIADMKFNRVHILDPHSKICIEQLVQAGTTVIELNLNKYVQRVVDEFHPDYICYPDKGAYNKYPKMLSDIKIPYFYGQKTRDLANKGRIVDYELVDAPNLEGKRVLIIDDICCLGGTAYNAAIQMKLAGASAVAFYISHCENGIFAGKILHPEPSVPSGSEVKTLPWAGTYTIDKVYTADTMKLNNYHENIKIIL